MIEYNQGPPPRDRYSDRPPAPAVDDRLDQARKVQQVRTSFISCH
jgi:hypothetical protein